MPREILCKEIIGDKIRTIEDIQGLRGTSKGNQAAIDSCVTEIEDSLGPSISVNSILPYRNLVSIKKPVAFASRDDIYNLATLPALRRATIDLTSLGKKDNLSLIIANFLLTFHGEHPGVKRVNFGFLTPFAEVAYSGESLCILYRNGPIFNIQRWEPVHIMQVLPHLTRFVGTLPDAYVGAGTQSLDNLRELILVEDNFDGLVERMGDGARYNTRDLEATLRRLKNLRVLGINTNRITNEERLMHLSAYPLIRYLEGSYENITRFDYPTPGWYLGDLHAVFPSIKKPLLESIVGKLPSDYREALREAQKWVNYLRLLPGVEYSPEIGDYFKTEVGENNYYSVIDCKEP